MQGKTINGFILQKLLGTGGMAEVWYAENKIHKPVAVKILSLELTQNKNIVSRFSNEAEIMVKLNHPNICQVYDYGDIDGRPSIVMEYLEGDDLKAMMKRGRCFSDEELRKWWNQLVDALNYTHAQNIVHRDIKPSNIFIDRRGDAKLLDFGIAKVADTTSGTQTGSTLGTRIYMSPEQVKDPKRVDYRTDLYSLAVSFVHLLTGKLPYDSTTTSDFEIQLSIVTKPLDISGLPLGWKSFLSPYLEKNPEKRPALKPFSGELYNDGSFQTKSSCVLGIDNDEGTQIDDGKREMPKAQKPIHQQRCSSKTEADLTFSINGSSFVMKRIEGGEFWMGAHCKKVGLLVKNPNLSIPNYDNDACENESPVHQVKLDEYYLGECEVTQALWNAVMGTTLRQQRDKVDPNLSLRGEGNDYPMYYVSWNDCIEFLNRLKTLIGKQFRLPTEAEWEFAARGGNNAKGCRYSGSNDLDKVAWYCVNSMVRSSPVMTKQPNELGLYDMSGNVWEWCGDRYGQYYDLRQINPLGSSREEDTGFVIRGGGWDACAECCRVSERDAKDGDYRSTFIGFRIALSVE